MDNQEILDRFDVLYNNIMSNQAPSLDAFEKSVFWNKASLEVLKNHLNPKGNKYAEGFDFSSKRQIEFSSLVTKEHTYRDGIEDNIVTTIDNDKILAILNESAVVGSKDSETNNHTVVVVPINNVEYDTLMSRPYKYPPKSQAWRVIDGVNQYRIISAETVKEYIIRYVKMPSEVDLNSNINSELPEVLHDEVLQRAVELAKNAWEGTLETTQTFGERSE